MKAHGKISVTNRQKHLRLDKALLRHVALAILEDLHSADASEVGLYFVENSEMTDLNEKFLHHSGSTDVITFDYSDPIAEEPGAGTPAPVLLHGEIFVCPEQAIIQSRRFRTDWREEIARYVVHGILHLAGFDDQGAGDRRRMKREESRLVAKLGAHFDLSKLASKPRR